MKKLVILLSAVLTFTTVSTLTPSYGQFFQNIETLESFESYSTPDLSTEEKLVDYLLTGRDAITESELLKREEELEELATYATDLFGSRLTSLVINGYKNEMLIFLYGEVSDAEQNLIQQDSRIHIIPTQNSTEFLDSQRQTLLLALQKQSVTNFGISISPDGSGLLLEVQNLNQMSLAETLAERSVSVDVIVEQGERVQTLDQRINSVNKGGAGGLVVKGTSRSFCSTAFAVLKGIQGFLLSASHCDVGGDAKWVTGVGNEVLTQGGIYVTSIPAADSLLINPIVGTQPKVFVGGIDSSVTRNVNGSAANFKGKSVCTSGANSGEHCGLLITNDSLITECIPGLSATCEMIKAVNVDGDVAAASGDSGGPVYSRNALGVSARGVISQGSAIQGYCTIPTNVLKYYDAKSLCSDFVIYMPIRPLLSLWNVELETVD